MAASYERARPLPILIHRASAACRRLLLLHHSCCVWRLRSDARGRDDGIRQKLAPGMTRIISCAHKIQTKSLQGYRLAQLSTSHGKTGKEVWRTREVASRRGRAPYRMNEWNNSAEARWTAR